MLRAVPNIPACSPERIQEIRTAFNDPNWWPSYCNDTSTQTTAPAPVTYPGPVGATTGGTSAGAAGGAPYATPAPAEASSLPVGIIIAGLVLLFLSME